MMVFLRHCGTWGNRAAAEGSWGSRAWLEYEDEPPWDRLHVPNLPGSQAIAVDHMQIGTTGVVPSPVTLFSIYMQILPPTLTPQFL